MENKIFSAFISSAFESLREERNQVIERLLDYRILPIGMEHFTISTDGEFSDIEDLIDESDFFILLLGENYGSCDANGISWTEREYMYATEKKKPTIAIICEELDKLRGAEKESLSQLQLKQIKFANSISFARTVSGEFGIKEILVQFFNTYNFSKCRGWTRIEAIGENDEALAKWREENRVFDIGGSWFHVHLSDDDEQYIRIGTLKIEQDFSPNTYTALHIEGRNFSVLYYDEADNVLKENKMKSSRFVGDYKLKENGEIFGIFRSQRSFSGTFNSIDIKQQNNRGIHDFIIDVFSDETDRIEGEFHDQAPSPKMGRIFMFKNEDERNEFVIENRGEYIKRK